MIHRLWVSQEPNNGFECLSHFYKYIDWLSSKSPDSHNFLSIQGHYGNEEPFRGKPFRIVYIFEFDKDMLREHDGVNDISVMQLVYARCGVIEEDEVTRYYSRVVEAEDDAAHHDDYVERENSHVIILGQLG